MGETLDAALAELFGGAPQTGRQLRRRSRPTRPKRRDAGGRLGAACAECEARRRYERRSAQRDLDWAKYGEEMKRLGEVLERWEGGAPADRALVRGAAISRPSPRP